MPDNHGPLSRRLRFFLRDFRMIDAYVSAAEGQSLASYISQRRRYINLRAAHWADATSDHAHAVIQVAQVLWASAPDGDMPLVNTSRASRPRAVEMQLEGGLVVHGALLVSEQQRLSDFLESTTSFIPVQSALLMRSGRPPKETNVDLGDIVVNQLALQAMWESEGGTPVSEVSPSWSSE